MPGWAEGLDDDRAAGGQGRGRVTPATEKASGKLLAPNTATGTDADEAQAQLRARRGALGQWRVDARVLPRAFTQQRRKQLELVAGAATLALQAHAGRPVSAIARSISASPMAMICAATPSRKSARCASDVAR